jgi:magnesium chelatase family protein
MLARRLTTLLPAMTRAAALATTRLHRVAGLTGERTAVVTARWFRAPHQTIAAVRLIGGRYLPMPGKMLQARHGMLFLDERQEFRRHVLFARPHARDVSGLSGFARARRASANSANSSLALECF